MNIFINLALVAIIAFAVTAASIPQIVKLAKAKKLYDTPNSRRVNNNIVPTLGGIAIFIGFVLGTVLGSDLISFQNIKYIFAGTIITFIAGIKDDLIGISPKYKLLALCAAILIISLFAELSFNNLHGFMGYKQIPFLPGILLTLFVGIVIINSLNLIDGIDGLATAIGIQISTVFGVWFTLVGQYDYALVSFALSGGCLAFFIYNVFGNRNKIFMGDTGSLFIGTIIFVLAAKFNQYASIHTGEFAISSAPAVLISIMAYPLFDVLRVFFLRVFIMRKSPFKPDKNHIHHRLLTLGMNHIQATTLIFIVNSIFIIGGLTLQKHLSVFELTIVCFVFAIFISTVLEIFILFTKRIKPDDKYQNLFLPRLLVNAVFQKAH